MIRMRERDEGVAVVEFVVGIVLIVVPLAYCVVALSKLHAASSGAVVAAREAARAFVTSDSAALAPHRARTAADIAMADQRVAGHTLSIRCAAGPCLSPGSRVLTEVRTQVSLPFTSFSDGRASITVSSTHEAVVDRYRRTP